MTDKQPAGDAARFTALWSAHAGRVLAYAQRHVGPDQAQEIVAETFLVAWRRLADVPGQPLPWLLVVARNTVANARRSSYRGALMTSELSRLHAAASPAADVSVADREHALAALAGLSDQDREALLLVAWDGLTPTEAAEVAGCSPSTFSVRLFRARQRLQQTLDDTPDRAAAVRTVPAPLARCTASTFPGSTR